MAEDALRRQFPGVEPEVISMVFESSGRDHAAAARSLQEMSGSASPAATPAPAPLVGHVLGLSVLCPCRCRGNCPD